MSSDPDLDELIKEIRRKVASLAARNPAGLDEWINEIKSSDPWTFESAFHGPRPSGPAVIPRLLSEMQGANDTFTRGKFIELLGEMGNSEIIPDIVAELAHDDQTVRTWAITALETIGGEAAQRALQRHRAEHPEDF